MRRLRRFWARNYLLVKKIWGKLASSAVPPEPRKIDIESYGRDDLAGKVVVITGSSRGIGLELARAFLKAGAKVVLNGRDAAKLELAASDLAAQDRRLLTVAADVSSEEGVRSLVSQTLSAFGGIDVLINNAATPGPMDRPLWDVLPEEWEDVLRSNLTAPFLCTREVIRQALQRKRHVRIINVSSGIVGLGAPFLGAYCVSKTALEGITTALVAEGDDGLVSAVNIRPRSVRTSMTQAYFESAEYALMDDASVVTDAFLYAAMAPAGEIQGRTINEPAFGPDPLAARLMHEPLSSAAPIRISPETYRKDVSPPLIEAPGSYMHLLENPMHYYPGVQSALEDFVAGAAAYRYPDPEYAQLRDAIAARLGLMRESVIVSNGSSELIDRLLRVFTQPGDHIVITKPTWSFFMAFMQRWKLMPTMIPQLGSMKEKNLRHDLDGMLSAITPRTRLLYLVNPCNPTGTAVVPAELAQFLDQVPAHVTVVIDEAYFDYAEPEKRFDLPAMLDAIEAPVVGLRTFSKFFALSGCRVGYAYGRAEVLALLEKAGMPFALPAISAQAAIAALGDEAAQQKTFASNHTERRRMASALDAMGIDNMPTETNFILYECPLDQDRMRTELMTEGLILPDVKQFLRNYALLPVGLPAHNERILDYLKRF
ncbi:SDR family NAD(P)-dependent oxidoreductase [Thiohalobacter sp. IOR34]|uniref:aminotransferase class I/II-fold pyridoxal phosphate-dependent enzyme n=1 Tax=Thiohalobacter sp. IOR34 TaxID=3057176 RepID=UPI0025B018E5|nr:aminotransferase class I/II-fold pyridoxal phosphate-dependent enzyme [Thiohalobacter sp. IOR34]WJW76301.1 SDR family NAD(P)-dependent oxidoreductase [Thiohalobacter sp. IOR34]